MSERQTTELRVFVRRVFGADGEMASQNEVYCVRRRCTLPVDECEACPDHDGGSIDLQRHRNYVGCAGVGLEGARGVGASRRPLLIRRPGVGWSTASRTHVSELMVADVVCARAELSASRLREVLAARAIGAVPVVDAAGRPLGMAAERDLLSAAPTSRVCDVMSPLTFTLPVDATIAEAAALMALERVHHLPILTEDDRVCGIVASLDVLGFMARSDGYVVGA